METHLACYLIGAGALGLEGGRELVLVCLFCTKFS